MAQDRGMPGTSQQYIAGQHKMCFGIWKDPGEPPQGEHILYFGEVYLYSASACFAGAIKNILNSNI